MATPTQSPVGTELKALRPQVEAWMAADPDPDTRSELELLLTEGAWEALAERFAGRLTFGTAGLRAELGAGPMRMNRLVVRQAAAGLLRYLQTEGHLQAEGHLQTEGHQHTEGNQNGRPRGAPLVVIGFDARHNSEVFAADSAAVLAAGGATVVRFAVVGPTPLLAFAVRYLSADAGVMVTASHNPPGDNGYKVYLGDGAQIVPPADGQIAAHIAAAGLDIALAAQPELAGPAVTLLPAAAIEAYLDTVVAQLAVPGAREVRTVYTPLHGVGGELALRAFERAGFPQPFLVTAQAAPDPDFPTTPLPNPEEPGTLDLALSLAAARGADLLLANDPDADRLGVAVPAAPSTTAGSAEARSGWRVLTGDEIGVLLADHLLRHRAGGPDRLVVTTLVSSRLLAALAADHGVHHAETLTGFKWIVRPALAHPQWRFEFGYEEALGYSVGPTVRDKDGIGAALVFAELVAVLKSEGSSVTTRLEELARRFGLYATRNWSVRFNGSGGSGGSGGRAAGVAAAIAAMELLRRTPPAQLAGVAVTRVRDWSGDDRPEGTAPSDIVAWDLADGARVVLRPSGTEPKLKVYVEVIGAIGASFYPEAVDAAEQRLDGLRTAVDALLTPERQRGFSGVGQ